VDLLEQAQDAMARHSWTEAFEMLTEVDATAQLGPEALEILGDAFWWLADYRRANEWDQAARRWCQRVSNESGFPGVCRVKRAEIMRFKGAWAEAEDEARRGCEELSDFPGHAAIGLIVIGEIRLSSGDLSGAETTFQQAHELGRDPQPGLALLRLAEGKHETACELIDSALEDDSLLTLERARLLLGQAYQKRDAQELSRLEFQAAHRTFTRLGAERDLAVTRSLLGEEVERSTKRVVRAMMFTDIVGSTNLINAIGDEAWNHLVRWHDQTLRSLFATHGGTENDHAGDGFFVVFPATTAAANCAIDIQRTLHRHRAESGFAPEVRIGIHTAEVTENDESHTGLEVHKAARIAALAGGGEILASS